ncbi:MAG: hypothetical protein CR985_00105 [Flavobacteriales bacterium]|nr:MAG: hypothetical protein CR985_00105 [Flavobacteriales bacterium]
MKRLILLSTTLLLILLSCKNRTDENTEKLAFNNIDTIKPKTSYKVHKEYDEDGNLISVDSTYTYFYSNIQGDSLLEEKMFRNFKQGFDANFTNIDSIMANDFFNDSLFKMHDFYTDDFFRNRFRINNKSVEEIFKRMDSLKNSFYEKQNRKL